MAAPVRSAAASYIMLQNVVSHMRRQTAPKCSNFPPAVRDPHNSDARDAHSLSSNTESAASCPGYADGRRSPVNSFLLSGVWHNGATGIHLTLKRLTRKRCGRRSAKPPAVQKPHSPDASARLPHSNNTEPAASHSCSAIEPVHRSIASSCPVFGITARFSGA